MTYQEFTTRTNVEVSTKEFDAINEVYMNSDVDKDEFCKMWCKMNAVRVERAIAEKKAAEKEEKLVWELAQIANREYTIDEYGEVAEEVLTKKQIKLMNEAGISLEKEVYNMCFNCYHIVPRIFNEVLFDIKKRIGIVK